MLKQKCSYIYGISSISSISNVSIIISRNSLRNSRWNDSQDSTLKLGLALVEASLRGVTGTYESENQLR